MSCVNARGMCGYEECKYWWPADYSSDVKVVRVIGYNRDTIVVKHARDVRDQRYDGCWLFFIKKCVAITVLDMLLVKQTIA